MTDPFEQFAAWYAEAQASEINDPNACALATVELDGDRPARPDVRIVLMKDFDARGFVVFTNYDSAKGRQIRSNPVAALDFHWKSLRRQVRMQAGGLHQVAVPWVSTGRGPSGAALRCWRAWRQACRNVRRHAAGTAAPDWAPRP